MTKATLTELLERNATRLEELVDTARRLDAELRVAAAYDFARAGGYMDTTAGRRRRALARLERELEDAKRRARNRGLAHGDTLEPDDTDVVIAFRRFAAAKINRHDAGPAVRNALRLTALELRTDATLAELGVAAAFESEPRR